jgi:hypothetical protein
MGGPRLWATQGTATKNSLRGPSMNKRSDGCLEMSGTTGVLLSRTSEISLHVLHGSASVTVESV